MERGSRRSVLGLAAAAIGALAGCLNSTEERVEVERVETVTVGDATVRGTDDLPEEVRNAVVNALERGANGGSWRLPTPPSEDESIAGALETVDYAVTTDEDRLQAGVYATFEYDPDEENLVTTAVFPTDADDVPLYDLVELPGPLREGVQEGAAGDRDGEVDSEAGVFDQSEYDGAYVRVDDEYYRARVYLLA